VIPDCCGECDYWQWKGLIDRYSGWCNFYDTETYFGRQCQPAKSELSEQPAEPDGSFSTSSNEPLVGDIDEQHDNTGQQVARTSGGQEVAAQRKKRLNRNGWILLAILLAVAVINRNGPIIGGAVGDTFAAGCFVAAIICFITAARVKK